MSINRKSKPNDAVESSSDDEETISTINTRPTEHPSIPDSQCSICLDELTNRCNTNSCLHLFCFECLQRWSNSAQFCPLCRKTFNYIYHSFDDLGVHETYNVPIQSPIRPRPLLQIFGREAIDRYRLNEDILRNLLRMPDQDRVIYTNNSMDLILYQNFPETPLFGIEMRTHVYITNAWTNPLPDSTGRFLDFTSYFYGANESQIHRLYPFILRDIIAIRESLRIQGQPMLIPSITDVLVTNYIMETLLFSEIRHLQLLDILRHVLDLHLVHFINELYNFARSSYDIRDYDDNVDFTFRLYDNELTEPCVLNSDNEEVQCPVNTTNVRSIEPRYTASIPADQPSTSTGTRESLIRPYYRIRRITSISPPVHNSPTSVVSDSSPFLFHLRRQRTNLDSSSDGEYPDSSSDDEYSDSSSDDSDSDSSSDDSDSDSSSDDSNSDSSSDDSDLDSSSDDKDSIIGTRDPITAHIKKKKKRKFNKNKKFKINTNDSGSRISSTNRNRSCSESSSTSEETDTN